MKMLEEKVDGFLVQKRIAIAGVSRNSQGNPGTAMYQKLKKTGYQVFPVNPN